ncbi:MAG: DUF5317 domain-containing protein [Acidimicrobiia bacterium]
MEWLALVLFVSVTVALLRGGRLINLADIRLRAWWLLILGFGLQVASNFLPEDASWASSVGVGLVLASFVPLLILVFLNRDKPGMWLAAIGILMNFTVIALNGGMPVLTEAAQVASGSEGDVILDDYKHVVMDADTWLPTLGDVIPLRLLGVGTVISLGDVFLAVGLGVFLESELRRPIRWFKKGARSRSGSAAGG